MAKYFIDSHEWYPVYDIELVTKESKIYSDYPAFSFTKKELTKIKRAFSLFDSAQKLIYNKTEKKNGRKK